MTIPHTSLTYKQVKGVIDHADGSVTGIKLADNIDMHRRGFNATKMSGHKLKLVQSYTFSSVPPGEYRTAPYSIPAVSRFMLAVRFPTPTGGTYNGYAVPCVRVGTNGKPKIALYNIGEGSLYNCEVLAYTTWP